MTMRQQLAARLAAARARVSAGWVDRRRHVILHIGPHRTGTTTIQATLKANAGAGARELVGHHDVDGSIGMITRADPAQLVLSGLTHEISSLQAARTAAPRIYAAAQEVARSLGDRPTTIISDEDMLGPLPTRRRIAGLYPFLGETLPQILAGFRDERVRVTVAWQRREYDDWMESVYHRRKGLAPERPFNKAQFQNRSQLPAGWSDFEQRLRRACAGVRVERLSFEDDAARGVMGHGLFRLAGMSEREIASLKHSRPRHAAPKRNTVGRFGGA